jgi:hypothetical protein
MGMPGKSLEIVLGSVRAKVVEQKKRIALLRVAESDRPMQMNACPFDGRAASDYFTDAPILSHGCPPFPTFPGHRARRKGKCSSLGGGGQSQERD